MTPRFRVLCGIGFVLSVTTASWAADQPPRNLHLVGDHWTAWNPPAAQPPGAVIYTIVRGDTLWDLAAKNLGNPYLWPQIWERNQYISDAHWIYPGDPLVLGIEAVPVEPDTIGSLDSREEIAPAEESAEPESSSLRGVLTAAQAAKPPQALGFEDDIYCNGYIGEEEEVFPYRVTGSEYQVLVPQLDGTADRRDLGGTYGAVATVKYGLDIGDILYLDGGRAAGLSPGQLLAVVERGKLIDHPTTGELVGRYYRYLGRVRVLSAQESSGIGELVHSCHPVTIGASLRMFEPEPVPLGRRTAARPVNDVAAADVLLNAPAIVHAEDDVVSLGQDQVVYIDRGSESDVVPGDTFTIYRLNREGFPPVPLGELAVLSVKRQTALARILESRNVVFLGDRLDRK
jgi:LysM domain